MKRILAVTVVVLAAVMAAAPQAFAWGLGVHTYVIDQIGKRAGDPNINEVYGSALGDLFNFAFDAPGGSDPYSDILHLEGVFEVAARKNLGLEKWISAGLYSHNEINGADRTAHIQGLVLGTSQGYVIEKAVLMKNVLEAYYTQYALSNLLPFLSEDEQILFYHLSVEYAVDLLLSQANPDIGPLLVAGTVFWPGDQPVSMLAETFADDVATYFPGGQTQAAAFIAQAELMFRQVAYTEGSILALPPEQAIYASADYMAYIAAQYLGALGIVLPDELVQMLPDLALAYLTIAQQLCPDYVYEVDATVDYVHQNLIEAGLVK